MKKIMFISILFVASLNWSHSNAQGIAVYPIPAFNVNINFPVNFREVRLNQSLMQTEEKRELDVEVKTPTNGLNCQATVWVYTLDYRTVLGPYTISYGVPLSVAIDESQWGAFIEPDSEMTVNVWIN
jgi:hypothetical protein